MEISTDPRNIIPKLHSSQTMRSTNIMRENLPTAAPTTNARLCSRCQELITYDGLCKFGETGFFEHFRFKEFYKSSLGQQPCPMCAVIRFELSDFPPFDDDLNPRVKLQIPPQRRSKASGIVSEFEVHCTRARYVQKFRLIAEEDDPAAAMTSARPPLTDVASDKAFDLARSWLSTCEETHAGCPKNYVVPKLPTYVVDVSPTMSSATARLYKPSEGEEAKYLCLSYCWGTMKQVTTNRSNLEAYLQEIPVRTLGQTIQDAIETTRRLGFRYLWVDALCIVQDDLKQKECEINMMSLIYKNATIVISAASASAASEGFLRLNRDLELAKILNKSKPYNFKFQVELPSGAIGNLALVRMQNYSPNHPLDHRAWAFQEHLLSARTLIFSSVELLVECRLKPRDPLHGSPLLYWDQNFGHRIFPSISDWDPSYSSSWSDLIRAYSQRRLTDPEDRLNAFTGIATEMETSGRKTVRFGIPAYGGALKWNVHVPVSTRSNRAPSWSWVCLDTIIGGPAPSSLQNVTHEAVVRFGSDEDYRKLSITSYIVDGATWAGEHPEPGEEAQQEFFPGEWPDQEDWDGEEKSDGDAAEEPDEEPNKELDKGTDGEFDERINKGPDEYSNEESDSEEDVNSDSSSNETIPRWDLQACYADLSSGLPDPQHRIYIRLLSHKDESDTVLILESAGHAVYRRTGIYRGSIFKDGWTKEAREMVVI